MYCSVMSMPCKFLKTATSRLRRISIPTSPQVRRGFKSTLHQSSAMSRFGLHCRLCLGLVLIVNVFGVVVSVLRLKTCVFWPLFYAPCQRVCVALRRAFQVLRSALPRAIFYLPHVLHKLFPCFPYHSLVCLRLVSCLCRITLSPSSERNINLNCSVAQSSPLLKRITTRIASVVSQPDRRASSATPDRPHPWHYEDQQRCSWLQQLHPSLWPLWSSFPNVPSSGLECA